MQAITRPFLQEQLIHKRREIDVVSSCPSRLSSFVDIRTCDHFTNTHFLFATQATRPIYPEFACSLVFPSQTQAESLLVFPSISIIHGKRLCDAICRLSIDIGYLFSGFVFPRFPSPCSFSSAFLSSLHHWRRSVQGESVIKLCVKAIKNQDQ